MSSNIEKLLDQFINQKGDKLVLGTQDPLHILKSGQKIPLMSRSISEREYQFIEKEFDKLFNSPDEFIYRDTAINSRKNGTEWEFFLKPVPEDMLIPETHVQSIEPAPVPFSPSQSTASQPEVIERVPANVSLSDDDEFLLDKLLKLMIPKKASDLHLTANNRPLMRIDGDMIILEEFPVLSSDDLLKLLFTIAPDRNKKEFEETNDSDFAYSIAGTARYRVNMFRDIAGVGGVFRIIPSKILTVEDLKVPSAVVKLCDIPKGLILVTGPTGSGKSTTLAALINHINATQKKHIITIEDPVEFVHPNKMSLVNQREINTHTQSFKRALRAALREDPDIILVGEMRDLETIAIAIEMAVTGHLVFGTLHTSTAIGTVDRIIDQFPVNQQQQIRTMLSDALIGVVAQTLLKRKEGGRVGAYEVLITTNAVSNLIRESKTYQIATIMQTSKGLGMQMINSHLLDLVEKGVCDADEALAKAIDKDNLRMLFKGKNIAFTV